MKYLTIAALLVAFVCTACNRFQATSNAMPEESQRPAKAARDEVALSPEQQTAAAIETRTAELSREPEILRVKGKVALADDRTWRVGVRTVGLVVAVYAGLGDLVHKGQVLARYHADEVRDSRALYRAAVAERDRSKAAAMQAQRNFDRAKRLLELKAGSARQVEEARQDVVDAQAAVKKSEIEVDRLRDLLEDDLSVPADPPASRKDETEDEVPIIAPGDGYIIEKNVTPGKSVEVSTVTFVIGDLSKVWMLASVREEDLGRLRKGQSAYVTLSGDDTHRFAGRITNLGQEFDPETRMMPVRIELNNRGNRLRPEMLANAEIPIAASKPALMIPSEAVQQVDGQDVVFVRKGPGHFLVRPVRIGETADGETPVLEGLSAGEEIAVRGSFILKSELLRASLESE